MTRYGWRLRLLAAAIAFQAGFVDALGFLHLGGYFVSFMSGNLTRLAVELAEELGGAIVAASIVGLFVCGVFVGTLVAHVARRRRLAVVQTLVTLLLAAAAVAQTRSGDRTAVALMTLAMGAANAAFARDGEVAIGVTYVTGALVKMGQNLAMALTGGNRTVWMWHALLGIGLAAGAVAGALAYGRMALSGLWIAVAFGATLIVSACLIESTEP